MASRPTDPRYTRSLPRRALGERRGNQEPDKIRFKKYSVNPVNGANGYWNSTNNDGVDLVAPNMSLKTAYQDYKPPPVLSAVKSSFQTGKRVTFVEPPNPDKVKLRSRRPLILNASHPHPILRHQISDTKIIIVRKGITTVVTGGKTETADHTFAPVKENPVKSDSADDEEPERVHFSVDMVGFENDEIHLYAKGKKLIVEGYRPECLPTISCRKVKETVTLPMGVDADNLKVSRDSRGMLFFEEAWKF